MHTLHGCTGLRELLDGVRAQGRRIVLVPTMGNLHEGHLELVRQARHHGQYVVATIFVNPFQFGPAEDLATYPRTFDEDSAALERCGVDLLLLPADTEVYPRGPEASARVEVPELGTILCGVSRPTFFRGVATVVNILLHMVNPDVALFGEKDYQQLLVIRRMVRDFWIPVEIASIATVRESDGLAMSSRNAYLSPPERRIAPALYRTLCEIKAAIATGERDFHVLGRQGMRSLGESGFRADYFSVRRAADLASPTDDDQDLIILAAGWLGAARLIDNLRCQHPG